MSTGHIPARGRLFFELSIDLATARLVKAMQALGDSQLEEQVVARGLMARAKAVRSWVEAGELELARATLADMKEVPLKKGTKEMLDRRIDAVSLALR
jgi:hypothetical protein